MVDLDEAYAKIYKLKEFEYDDIPQPKLSYPLLEEVDGKTYVVFMGYTYEGSDPDLIFTYGLESEEADSMPIGDALKLFGIKDFPVIPRYEVEAGDPLLLQDYFWDAIETGKIDRENYHTYISTLVNHFYPLDGKYYWAFAD